MTTSNDIEHDSRHQPELVEVVPQSHSAPEDGGARWSPVIGAETSALLDHLQLPPNSRDIVQREAVEILAGCVPPTVQEGHDIGLVVGYVQSGKTLSFTTVAALARDNKYQMVIVLAGTSTALLGQSQDRLRRDLQLETSSTRKWRHFSNPSPRGADRSNITNTLDDWRDPAVTGANRRTVLITVMKNRTRLDDLIKVLSKVDLRAVPTLVIDDEADQAGLNTRVKHKEKSATYQRIEELRKHLPQHTYLQYTATPQAPLLINIIDILSPRFVQVLTPGPEYVGGKDFFVDQQGLVRTIPDSEIPTETHRLNEPPESLLYALRIFFLGVAAGLLKDEGEGNRSMMIHPSQRTAGHGQYLRWVRQAIETWKKMLDLEEQDPDRQDLMKEFKLAYDDLKTTAKGIPSIDQLVSLLLRALRSTRVEEINARSGETPHIDWTDEYAYILVGGQAMDRGFTVEGLTVTYMPRSLGVANADTVQQRARFFGYKRRYLGYCRVFLPGSVRDAYRHYVIHEEDVRNRLIEHRSTGRSMSEWKREFFLNAHLRPTRHNVLGLDYMHIRLGNKWIVPKAPHETPDAVQFNREVVKKFRERLSLVDDEGHPDRTEMQKHKVAANVPLRDAYEHLLTPLRMARTEDSQQWTQLLLQLTEYLSEHPDAKCAIYYMGGGRLRKRSVDEKGEVENVFQGANPSEPAEKKGSIYPGDREIKAKEGVTIQLRCLTVRQGGQPIANDVPVAAVWLPEEVASDIVIQNRG